MGRKGYGYLLLDFPADHEVDSILPTECDTIRAVLHNRNLGSRLKLRRCSSIDRFKKLGKSHYRGIRFVHLAGHASRSGLGLIGGMVEWKEVADAIKDHLDPLRSREQRVLALSCCFSEAGLNSMKSALQRYFTGAYYFAPEKIDFSTSLAVWSMFYLKKRLNRPHKKVADDINKFFEQDILVSCP